jgi:carbon storage regulator CsrA
MLVLSRRLNERIVLPGTNTVIEVIAIKPHAVRLGVQAPAHVAVYREEVLARDDVTPSPPAAADRALRQLDHVLSNRLNVATVGVALLRRQLEAGLTQGALATLDRIDQEVQRLQEGVQKVTRQFGEPRPSRRALLVEDDSNECELLAGFLRLAGMDVVTAGDGADALDYLRAQGPPDALVLDMLLPRCDGAATLRAIRRERAYDPMKVFAVSGRPREHFDLRDDGTRIDRWFCKPINPEVLLSAMLQQLGTQR